MRFGAPTALATKRICSGSRVRASWRPSGVGPASRQPAASNGTTHAGERKRPRDTHFARTTNARPWGCDDLSQRLRPGRPQFAPERSAALPRGASAGGAGPSQASPRTRAQRGFAARSERRGRGTLSGESPPPERSAASPRGASAGGAGPCQARSRTPSAARLCRAERAPGARDPVRRVPQPERSAASPRGASAGGAGPCEASRDPSAARLRRAERAPGARDPVRRVPQPERSAASPRGASAGGAGPCQANPPTRAQRGFAARSERRGRGTLSGSRTKRWRLSRSARPSLQRSSGSSATQPCSAARAACQSPAFCASVDWFP